MRAVRRESGLLSLEACIAVPIFIFLMLFMFSYYGVFEARNQMAHAVLATANSLGLDAYESDALTDADTLASVLREFTNTPQTVNSPYTDRRKWYNNANVTTDDGSITLSADFEDVVRNRFLAYLGGGDPEKAEALLKRYNIRGGADGLDFSGSRSDGEKVWLSIKYTIDYEFRVFHTKGLELEQTACSKLWS